MGKPLTRLEEIERISSNPESKHSIKLLANLYAYAKKGSSEEKFLYNILIRRCKEEGQAT